jgi:hypothetical protein
VLRVGTGRGVGVGVLAAAVLAVVVLIAPSSASAGIENYCGPQDWTSYASCMGERHNLNGNQAHGYIGSANQDRCAGAKDVNLNFHGSYACGVGSAIHCYSGGTLLYPMWHNSEPYTITGYGTMYYGVSACP